MPQSQPAKRKWWTGRRKFFAGLWCLAVVLVGIGVLRVLPVALSHPDYRDPGQLAQAVKAHEHGAVSAACSHLTGSSYICSVDFPGTSIGTYQVTVAADGSSYTAS